MKNVTVVILLFVLSACGNSNSSEKSGHGKNTSSKLSDAEIEIIARRRADSLIKAVQKEALFDTVGLFNAPVKVLSAKLVKRDYSNYRDISITFKNVSDKRIEGVKFSWYGEDAFGDPADMGNSFVEGFGGGFDDDALSVSRTRTSRWSILSNNAKKIILAWPTEVAFSDGTKWEIGEK